MMGASKNMKSAAHEGVWQQMLQKALHGSSRLNETKQVVLIGDPNSGKAALARQVFGVGENGSDYEMDNTVDRGGPSTLDKKGLGLGYEYVNINTKDEDTVSVGVWTLGSDEKYGTLLSHAVNADTIASTLFVFVVDWSKPWLILPSLQKWVDVLEKQIDNIFGNHMGRKHEMEDRLIDKFRLYKDPKGGMEDIENELKVASLKRKPKRAQVQPVGAIERNGNNVIASGDLTPVKKTLPPLGLQKLTNGALINNIGVDMMVVATKADLLSTTDTLSSEQTDFILRKLRIFCLEYGMGLLYTSTTSKTNCDTLLNYILHLLYERPFSTTANVVVRDHILVPRGWDTIAKIDVMADYIKSFHPDEAFEDIIRPPATLRATSPKALADASNSSSGKKTPQQAEQDFLHRIQILLEEASTNGGDSTNLASSRHTKTSTLSYSSSSTPMGSAGSIESGRKPNPSAFFHDLMKKGSRNVTPKN
eukprot:CFRG1727T1